MSHARSSSLPPYSREQLAELLLADETPSSVIPLHPRVPEAQLLEPRIPRAPQPARLSIELVDGSLRVIDPVDSPVPPSLWAEPPSGFDSRSPHRRARGVPWSVTLVAVSVGFVVGLGMALLTSIP